MSGYQTILRVRRLEETVEKLGFMMTHSKHGWDHNDPDKIALKPRDADAVPIYARDAEVFYGTLEELEVWLRGVEWARNYDLLLKVSDEKKRERREQDLRNQYTMQRLKNEKVIQKD